MLYDSYHVKISKIVAVLRKIFKHIVLISIVSALIVTMIVAFMATKGLIIDDSSVMSGFKMTYGEPLPLKAKAVFSSVDYEYSSDGVKWSAEMPRDVGDFKVRACANNIFGQKRYGEVYSFTINPKEIDVSVVEDEILYGELPTVEAELAFEDSISCDKVSYSDRLAKTTDVNPVLDSIKITNSDGKDVTKLYKLNAVAKSIKILPRDIEVTVSNQEMIYNDVKFSYDGYELSDGELAEGDILQAVFDKYLIDVGEVVNTPTLRVVTSDGLDVSIHYEIATEIGTLKVNKRPLIVKAAGAEKEYDDTELINKSFEIAGDYKLVESHVANCVSHTSITNVEEKENIIAIEIKNAGGEDKTPNYSLFYENGTLKITPRKINVTTPSKESVYNAQPLTTEDTPTSSYIDRLVAGHDVNSTWQSIVDAGSVENTVSITKIFKNIEDEFGADIIDVTQNYEIIYGDKGTLTVKKCPITITYESNSFVYDGSERTFESTSIDGDHPQNDIFEFEYPKFSQAGKYENANKAQRITVTSWRDDGTAKVFDASENYEITEIAGTIEIAKRVYRIIAFDKSKIYDGTVFTPDSTQIGYEDIPLADHNLEVKFKSTESADVGEYPLELESFKVMFGEIDATSNFDVSISQNYKWIYIEERTITLTANSKDKYYSGANAWEMSEYSGYTPENLVEGHKIVEENLLFSVSKLEDYQLTNEEKDLLVSKWKNNVDENSICIVDANGKDVTNNYIKSSKPGTLEIFKIEIKVKTESHKKVYDGKPLNCLPDDDDLDTSACNHTYQGLPYEANPAILDGDVITASIKDTSTITNVDKVANEAYISSIKDPDLQYYRLVKDEFGTLEITPRTIRITPSDVTKTYDAEPNEQPDYTKTSGENEGLISEHELNVVFKTLTDAGEIPVEYESFTVKLGDEDLSKNYNLVVEGGAKIVINRRPLSITSMNAKKKYDGRPLTYAAIKDTGNLVSGHSIEGINMSRKYDSQNRTYILEDIYDIGIDIVGSQTKEGSSDNIISGTPKIFSGDTDVTKNYDITVNYGTLEVYKDTVAYLYTGHNGSVYLKSRSYGNYNGSGFIDYSVKANGAYTYAIKSPNYISPDYNNMYLPTQSIGNSNIDSTYIYLSSISNGKYMLPYYMYNNYSLSDPYVDNYSDMNYTSYDGQYYDYSFEKEGSDNLDYNDSTEYHNYRSWVYNQSAYLDTDNTYPSGLISEFRNFIGYNEYSRLISYADKEELIKTVAWYVRSAATYNTDYNIALDNPSYDVAYDFLHTYKDGDSKHFAIAATMLYRSLGIPARYVEGYFVEAKAYETVDVKDEHAWVEVFVDGYGWMQMEVTPGFGMESGKQEITIKPKDASKEYDGTAITASDYEFVSISDELKELFDSGDYRIEVEKYFGAQTDIGKSDSRIEQVRIIDRGGNDVTYEFDIKTETGTLEITQIQVEVYLYGISKTYDGTPLSYADSVLFSIRDQAFKATGYKLNLEVLFDNADIHTLTVADLNELIDYYISYTVMDGTKDITDRYCIRIVPLNPNAPEEEYSNYVVYAINKVQLVLEAESITQYYEEGMVLEGPEVKIVGGGLLEGHTLSATAIGRIDKVGTVNNEVDIYTLSIVDQNGYDVTDKYDIETRKGILQLIAKPEK